MTVSTPLAVAVGDPAGIGPEVAARGAVAVVAEQPVALFGDARYLRPWLRAADENIRTTDLSPGGSLATEASTVGLAHVADWPPDVVTSRAPTPEGGRTQLAVLDAAISAVSEGRARALVTGPMSKAAVTAAGIHFAGQTEHIAQRAGMSPESVTMTFVGPRLCVALVTTHLAVRDVSDAVTEPRVRRAAIHAAEAALSLRAGESVVRIAVTGLNPHAGEKGLFGAEEAERIVPGLDAARNEPPFVEDRARLEGPIPAETAFRLAGDGQIQGVVAMMHDQATIASKLLDWGAAVNVTWGLPFTRTSVDHGVAYDLAGSGNARPDGMIAALRMARRLTTAT